MTPEQMRMFKRLIDAHEFAQKLSPRTLGDARRMLAKAMQHPTPIEGQQP